ncbi:MAG TPA: ABC transporter ATP-binding protein, partial [Stellaceae bacterium]|nr:ABC transporter ATP-binding protein [Stellaceae bacterium]
MRAGTPGLRRCVAVRRAARRGRKGRLSQSPSDMPDIRHLVKRLDSLVAADDVSFAVPQGEVLGFLGPNGAGKSTTMKMAAGFLAPTAGTAAICGHDILEQPIEAKRRLGYLPEGAPAYPDMAVRDFLGFVAAIRGLRGAGRTARLARVVEMMRLGEVLNQPIETLSKGYRRRVG